MATNNDGLVGDTRLAAPLALRIAWLCAPTLRPNSMFRLCSASAPHGDQRSDPLDQSAYWHKASLVVSPYGDPRLRSGPPSGGGGPEHKLGPQRTSLVYVHFRNAAQPNKAGRRFRSLMDRERPLHLQVDKRFKRQRKPFTSSERRMSAAQNSDRTRHPSVPSRRQSEATRLIGRA